MDPFTSDDEYPAQTLDFWRNLDTTFPNQCLPEEQIAATHRNGYHALKRSNPKLYRQWTKHLKVCFDLYDCGYKYGGNGGTVRANTKHTLNYWLDQRNKGHRDAHRGSRGYASPLISLTLKDVEAHGQHKATIYYTSNPNGRYAVLLLDIDDKKGEAGTEDVQAVWRELEALFPNVYNQTSTGGKGWHGYLTVHYEGTTVHDFRILVDQLEDALQAAIHSRFRSTAEIKGKPGLRNSTGGYVTCGTLAKIPRLPDEAAIADYLSRPFYTVAHLQDVIGRPPMPVCDPHP